MKPDIANGLREAFTRIPGGECAITAVGINYGCPIVRQRTCIALEDLAQAFQEARQPAQSQEQRDKAARDFGCPAQ